MSDCTRNTETTSAIRYDLLAFGGHLAVLLEEALETAGEKTEEGLRTAAKATGRFLQKVGGEIEDAAHRVAGDEPSEVDPAAERRCSASTRFRRSSAPEPLLWFWRLRSVMAIVGE